MAFDESYHFALIQFFTHHLNPFISSEPSSSYNLGAIPHNPSIFYHYLLSFPLRLITLFTSNIKTEVILLRLSSLLFAIITIIFIRKILNLLRLPSLISNLVIFVYCLTPIVSVLASQLNYDNLLLPCSTITVYLTIKAVKQINKRTIPTGLIIGLITFCLFCSEVKFSYLPIFAGSFIAILYYLYKSYKGKPKKLLNNFKKGYLSIEKPKKIVLSCFFVVGLAIFMNFYGYNLVKYHTLTAQCQQVIPFNDCKLYYPWERNEQALEYKKAHPTMGRMSIPSFTVFWLKVEYYQLFGEVIPIGGLVYIVKEFYGFIIFLSVLGVLTAIYQAKTILKKHVWVLPTIIITVVYLIGLWLRNYNILLQYNKPLAIQGRYLLPVLVYFYSLLALGMYYTFLNRAIKKAHIGPIITTLTIIMFLVFGGFMRYVRVITPKFGWSSQTTKKVEVTSKPSTF
jgi:hypothetical protein